MKIPWEPRTTILASREELMVGLRGACNRYAERRYAVCSV